MEGMIFMFGTQALLAAHERMCMENRERMAEIVTELKESIRAVERRQEEAVGQLQQSVSKITSRVAWMLGAATASVVLIEHFHLLAKL